MIGTRARRWTFAGVGISIVVASLAGCGGQVADRASDLRSSASAALSSLRPTGLPSVALPTASAASTAPSVALPTASVATRTPTPTPTASESSAPSVSPTRSTSAPTPSGSTAAATSPAAPVISSTPPATSAGPSSSMPSTTSAGPSSGTTSSGTATSPSASAPSASTTLTTLPAQPASSEGVATWVWILLALVVLAAIAALAGWLIVGRRRGPAEPGDATAEELGTGEQPPDGPES